MASSLFFWCVLSVHRCSRLSRTSRIYNFSASTVSSSDLSCTHTPASFFEMLVVAKLCLRLFLLCSTARAAEVFVASQCGGDRSCCRLSDSPCNIADMDEGKGNSTMIFPGGETRCIASTSTDYAFQVALIFLTVYASTTILTPKLITRCTRGDLIEFLFISKEVAAVGMMRPRQPVSVEKKLIASPMHCPGCPMGFST